MKASKELQLAIVNNHQDIRSIEVTYSNGEIISGIVKDVTGVPSKVILCQHQVQKGQDPEHILNFSDATKITLRYHDGREELFN